MKILFCHGWSSTPGGTKPTFLASHGHEVLNPALPDEDLSVSHPDFLARMGIEITISPTWNQIPYQLAKMVTCCACGSIPRD